MTSQYIHGECDILDAAIARYPKRIFPPAPANIYSHLDPHHRKQMKRHARREMKTDPMFKGYIETVEIVMNNQKGCEKYPYMDMDEHCE